MRAVLENIVNQGIGKMYCGFPAFGCHRPTSVEPNNIIQCGWGVACRARSFSRCCGHWCGYQSFYCIFLFFFLLCCYDSLFVLRFLFFFLFCRFNTVFVLRFLFLFFIFLPYGRRFYCCCCCCCCCCFFAGMGVQDSVFVVYFCFCLLFL